MKFAANIEMWWTDLPFIERIEQAAIAGFRAIEFWEYQDKDIDAIADEARKHNIEITQFTAWGWDNWMNDPKNTDLFIKQIREACDVGKKLNCKMGTVVGGNDQDGMTQDEMHEQIIRALKEVAPMAEEEDFTLILEPMNIRVDHAGHCLYGSEPGIKICKEVNSSHVKLNWDLYHMQISEGDLCGHLKEGMDQIGYIQLADHPGRHEPGTGEINYVNVLEVAVSLGYQGYFGLECSPFEDEIKAKDRLIKLFKNINHQHNPIDVQT